MIKSATSWFRPEQGGYTVRDSRSGATHLNPEKNVFWREYDPFEQYHWAWEEGDVNPPYMSFLNLDPDRNWEIRDWMSDYGPLGVLPQYFESVKFLPRYKKSDEDSEAYRIRQMKFSLHRDAPKYDGVAELDAQDLTQMNPVDGETLSRNEVLGFLKRRSKETSGDGLNESTIEFPAIELIDPFRYPAKRRIKILDGVPCFPGIGPERFEQIFFDLDSDARHAPSTWLQNETFRNHYQEPFDWIEEAIQFLRGFRKVAHKNTSIEDLDPPNKLLPAINAILNTVHPVAQYDEESGGVQTGTHYRSLLGAFVYMMLQDLDREERYGQFKTCQHCGELFSHGNRKKKYCSNSCRDAYHNARR